MPIAAESSLTHRFSGGAGNLKQTPGREMIFTVGDYKSCCVDVDELPARSGPVCLGLNIGKALSGSAAFGIFPRDGPVRNVAWLR